MGTTITQDGQDDTSGTDRTEGSSLGQGHSWSSAELGVKPLHHLTLSQAWLCGCAICQDLRGCPSLTPD